MLIQNVPISMTELFELIGSKDDQILQPSDIYSGSLTGKVNRILRWIGNPYETWQETDDYSLTKINRGMIELIGIPPLGDTIIDGTNVPHIESLHGKIRQLEEKIDNLDISPPAIQTTSPIKSIQRGVIGGEMTTDYTDGRRDTHRITLSPVNINKSIVILSAKGYTVNFSSNRLDIAVDSYAVDNGTSMYIYHYYHYVSWQVIEFV